MKEQKIDKWMVATVVLSVIALVLILYSAVNDKRVVIDEEEQFNSLITALIDAGWEGVDICNTETNTCIKLTREQLLNINK